MAEEYIKREDACKALDNLDLFPVDYVNILDKMRIVPAADVTPVRHAKWVPNSINTHAKCSCCGEPATLVKDDENFQYCEWYSPYCPNCGSKMDMEETECD